MNKGASKVHFEEQPNQNFKEIDNQPNKLDIKDPDIYPNRLICYIRMKLTSPDTNKTEEERKLLNDKGTGCILSKKYLLTAAHNIIGRQAKVSAFKNSKTKFDDESYIKQGLGKREGEQRKYINLFKIKQSFMNPKYKSVHNTDQSLTEDYGILEIDQGSPDFRKLDEEKFMPIVVLSNSGIKHIKQIFICGYDVQFNRKNSSQADKSSIFMNFMSGGSNQLKQYEKTYLTYSIKTEYGISGAPIVAKFDNQFIIIGIHKGQHNEKEHSLGVSASQMIEQLNNLGYALQKRPFVYTEKTLTLREFERQMAEREILFLMDRGLENYDILVFTGFDLTRIKKIILSGNLIGNKGLEYLLRRKYPNMKSLFLTQNKIDDLSSIPQQNWHNIENLATLALNINMLVSLPKGIMHLKKLDKLWLAHNHFKKIPEALQQYCKVYDKHSLSIYLYDNNINFKEEQQKIVELGKGKARIVWSRDGHQTNIK